MEYDFSNHTEITYSKQQIPDKIERVSIQQKGTLRKRIAYYKIHNLLFVTGDFGTAAYAWNSAQIHDLAWMADTEFAYFFEKCVSAPPASCPNGKFQVWDSETFMSRLHEELAHYLEYNESSETVESLLSEMYKYGFKKDDFSRFRDWGAWLEENGEEIFNEEYLYSYELHNISGYVPHPWAHAHHQGLKYAVTKLKEKGQL